MARPIRPIRVDGDVAYVPLTKGYEAVIDAADVPMVAGRNWSAHVELDGRVYAVWENGRNAAGKKVSVRMHRMLMGAPDEVLVDHKDGDGLNNRRSSNLRLATHSQNCCNSRLRPSSRSGVKGVSFHKPSGLWFARIKLNGKARSLGYFRDKDSAALAYAKASPDVHGEFGRVA